MDEAMIQMIVETVMREISAREWKYRTVGEHPMLLVVGTMERVPAYLAEEYELVTLEEYNHDRKSFKYQKILITSLTFTELSDIAQGRDGSLAASVVVPALLDGVEVCMLKNALPHAAYAGRGSTRLYEVIEQNARMLQSFGIKLIDERLDIKTKTVSVGKESRVVSEQKEKRGAVVKVKLITEETARQMADAGEKELYLSADTIITPLARDLFRERAVRIIKKNPEVDESLKEERAGC